jgi:hypothetical protein
VGTYFDKLRRLSWSRYVEEGYEMLKRTLIAIAVVALLATSAQALGPEPHTGGGNSPAIKVNLEKIEIGWPFEYKALDLCVIPVYMHVGYFVQVEKCNERKIKLVQVDCADIGKGGGDWPCYKDCENVKVRANFEVKLGLKKSKIGDVLKDWSAYFQGGDVVAGDGAWHTVTVCVDAWKAQLYKNAPGTSVKVGEVTITVKPNV